MSDPSRPSLRERRKQETLDHVRRIALELVAERGYDAVTVDLISDRAGVSARTFFNYFPNKESAMVAMPPPLPESAVQQFLARRGTRNLFADLADLAVSLFEEGSSPPSDFEASMLIVMGVPTLAKLQFGALAELEHQFTQLIAARLEMDAGDAQPAVIAAAFMGAVRVAGQRLSRGSGQPTLADEVRACLAVLSTAPARASQTAPDRGRTRRGPVRRGR